MKVGIGATALACLFVAGAAHADDNKIKIGVTATLEGTYTILGVDGIAGLNAAEKKYGAKVGGKDLEFIIASTDATPDSAVRAVRKLIEQDHVQILLSPLSGDEGIAVKNFSRTHPELTFINAASGAQETTFPDPSPNFFRWNMDGAQWQVGLGDYAYNQKGYRKIATVGEDYSFVYTQVMGLVLDFCRFGGQVTSRQWVPLGTKDFASTIAALPDDVDAIYLGLGGADAVNFLNQYQQAGGKAHLLGGSIMVDQTVLSAKGDAKKAMIGTIAASGMADTWEDPRWQAFIKLYQEANSGRQAPAEPWPPGDKLLWRGDGDVRGPGQGQRRPERQPVQVQGDACGTDDRRPERQDQPRRGPAGDRHELRHRGCRGQQRRPCQQGGQGCPRREPDAGLSRATSSSRSGRRAAPTRSARSTEPKRPGPGARSRLAHPFASDVGRTIERMAAMSGIHPPSSGLRPRSGRARDRLVRDAA